MTSKRTLLKLSATSLALVALSLSLPLDARNITALTELRERLENFVEPTVKGEKLFDVEMNIDKLDAMKLNIGEVAETPWSGDYWPLRFGAISAVYNDEGGYRTGLFGKLSYQKMEKRFDKKWRKLDPRNVPTKDLEDLAPSEKLDLLLSDYNLTLSNSIWKSIANHYAEVQHVGMWEGFCHGWSTAAIQAPRPVRSIKVPSRDGRYMIPFSPDDLKGLATYLWGESLIQDYTKIAGKRCFKKKSNPDPYTGLSDDPACNGVEASLFHLSLVHLVGLRKESFIINRTADDRVWNQPLKSYTLKYFNLRTGKNGTLAESVTPVEALGANVERSERDPAAKFLVGVDLNLKYVKENKPSRADTDSPDRDNIRDLNYLYDLELDADHNIIGGRWRDKRTGARPVASAGSGDFDGFPGFIWKIQRSEIAALSVASDAPMWDVNQPIPGEYLARHRRAADFHYKIWKLDSEGKILLQPDGKAIVYKEKLQPQPLSMIVHGLLRAAKDPADPRTLDLRD